MRNLHRSSEADALDFYAAFKVVSKRMPTLPAEPLVGLCTLNQVDP
jgi:hypothetical protein